MKATGRSNVKESFLKLSMDRYARKRYKSELTALLLGISTDKKVRDKAKKN